MCTVAPCVQLQHVCSCTMCTVAPSVRLHHVYSCIMCTVAPCVRLHHEYSCTTCTVAPCVQLHHVYSCTTCTVAPCVQLHHVYNSLIFRPVGRHRTPPNILRDYKPAITVQFLFTLSVTSTLTGSTVQYSTVQYSTVQYSTVQCSTVQYSTVQPGPNLPPIKHRVLNMYIYIYGKAELYFYVLTSELHQNKDQQTGVKQGSTDGRKTRINRRT